MLKYLTLFALLVATVAYGHGQYYPPTNQRSTTVRIAEHYSGADIGAQIEAAMNTLPAGGTILITEDHTYTTAADINVANITIECAPGVTLTLGNGSVKFVNVTAAYFTLRGCRLDGKKNTYNQGGIYLLHQADYALIEYNEIHDYRANAVRLDANDNPGVDELVGVVVQNNHIDNILDATGLVTTSTLISCDSRSQIRNAKFLNNTLISKDSGGDGLFCFVHIPGSENIHVIGNIVDVKGINTAQVTGCMELAGTDGSGGSTLTAPDDYIPGTVVSNNTCNMGDYVFQGMAPFGFSRGAVYSGNVHNTNGTNGVASTLAQSEIGNMYAPSITGNSWNIPNGNGRAISLHHTQNATISGNTFTFSCPTWLTCGDEAIFMPGDSSHSPATHLTTQNISITGNVFNYPTPRLNINQHAINLYCDGNTANDFLHSNFLVANNVFNGQGTDGAGTGESTVLSVTELGPDGQCDISNVNLIGNMIYNLESLIRFNGNAHTHSTVRVTDNKITSLSGAWFFQDVATGTLTGFYVNGEGAEPPVTGAECADGSIWMDTVAGGAICGPGTAIGDLCTCNDVGNAWTIH